MIHQDVLPQILYHTLVDHVRSTVITLLTVSKEWNRVTTILIPEIFIDDMTTHDQLLAYFTHVETLSLNDSGITGQGLLLMTNLTKLDLRHDRKITDEYLTLTGLRSLKLLHNDVIVGYSISNLVNLTSLDLYGNGNVDDECLYLLTNLAKLDIGENCGITGDCVSMLTNLTTLGLNGNDYIEID